MPNHDDYLQVGIRIGYLDTIAGSLTANKDRRAVDCQVSQFSRSVPCVRVDALLVEPKPV